MEATEKREKIGIVGGGIGGLSLGWKLAKDGKEVVIFEKEEKLGGLVAGFRLKKWLWYCDFFYRHLFPSDRELRKFLKVLGKQKKLFFQKAKTAVFIKGKVFNFDSPGDILRFSPLSFFSRLRLGGGVALLKLLPFFSFYDFLPVNKCLPLLMGREGAEKVWQPLFIQKFSQEKAIPFSWFWARVKKRTGQLGYYQGGWQKLINFLKKEIEESGGRVKRGFKVEKIKKDNKRFLIYGKGKTFSFDKVILTTPLPVALKIAGSLLQEEKEKFSQAKYVGAAVFVLRLKNDFLPDNIYWLSILEKDWPFTVVVEQTHFLKKHFYGGDDLVYIGGYYPLSHPIFSEKEEYWSVFLPFLKKINPRIETMVKERKFFSYPFAQPIPELGWGKKVPSLKTSVPGLFWLNMNHIYPWDRGMNFAVKEAWKLAEVIEKEKG